VIGGKAQHLMDKGPGGVLVVGNGNRIREHVTIHRGFAEAAVTRLGNDNLLMAGVHVGSRLSSGEQRHPRQQLPARRTRRGAGPGYLGGAVAVHQFCASGGT